MLRAIKVEDIGLIIEMLLTLHVESPHYGKVTPDEPYVRETLASMIEQPSFIGIVDVDLRGLMFGTACRQWYDSELNAYEQLLYVLPEYRGTTLAPRLIRDFERNAGALGCVHVHAGVTTLIRTEQTLQLYERLGYTRDGTGVFKRIQGFV